MACQKCKELEVSKFCNDLNYEYTEHFYSFMAETILETTSGLMLSFVGFYMLLSKKFKQHPYPIIGIASLIHGGFYFS